MGSHDRRGRSRDRPSAHELPDDATRDLHDRVLRRDERAFDDLVRLLRPWLRRVLRRAYPRTASDFAGSALHDALLDYWRRPERFDSARGVPLVHYLAAIAKRNLADVLRMEARRKRRESTYAAKAPLASPAGQEIEAASTAVADDGQQTLAQLAKGGELAAFTLWRAGERRTQPLATALQLAHLPLDAQRREVKRFKDRIIKRAQRASRRAARSRLDG